MEILVVGGAGAMGGWFVDFFRDRGWSVDVSDPDADGSVSLKDADGYDAVVVAVPIDATPDVIERVASRMEDGLLMDITSVKREPVEAMRSAPEDVELLGTHPMFGPSVRSMRGQTVIVVRERTGPLAERVIDAFAEAGANVQEATAQEHDEMMSVVQGLTHYSLISIGGALKRLDFDIDESRRFMSPVYEIILDFVGRVLNQNPELYAEIQTNQPVGDVHDALIDSSEALRDAVRHDDVDGFVDEMLDSTRHYGDTKSALRRSDKLIEANVREYDELHASVGEERVLQHVYSGNVHVGVVRDVRGRTVYLDEDGETVELKTENVELLSRDEARGWKKRNLPRRERDVSAAFPATMEEEVLEDVAESCHDDVLDAAVFDIYEGDAVPDGWTSYTVRLELLDDGEVDEAVKAVRETFEGIGGKTR
ncbi:MAG: prephenate dehydrogenase/arogenate dehydrogenase family protein [Halobacteria archaeon]